jgi:hypothetical protein
LCACLQAFARHGFYQAARGLRTVNSTEAQLYLREASDYLTWFEETESLLFNAPSSAGIVSSIHNTGLEVRRVFLIDLTSRLHYDFLNLIFPECTFDVIAEKFDATRWLLGAQNTRPLSHRSERHVHEGIACGDWRVHSTWNVSDCISLASTGRKSSLGFASGGEGIDTISPCSLWVELDPCALRCAS